MDDTVDLSGSDLESRKRFAKSVKAHLTEGGSIFGRMASSHAEAQAEPQWFLNMIEDLNRRGVTPDQVDENLGLK